jgi:hypothetical protein
VRRSPGLRLSKNHGTEEIRPSRPRGRCPALDSLRNVLARTAAQIRTAHWMSVVYPKRIRKMTDDKCWFCQTAARMTRSHVRNAKFRAAGEMAVESRTPGGVRLLLANSRWERRVVRFLELSGVGRVMADRTDEDGAHAARMDEWVAWEAIECTAPQGELRTAYCRGRGISLLL